MTLPEASHKPTNRLLLMLLNIVAIVIAVPLVPLSMMMSVFASDSGPNPIAWIAFLLTLAVIPAMIYTIARSQAKQSLKWAGYAIAIPFLPLASIIVPGPILGLLGLIVMMF
ncbi:MAG: hypothetical protein AAB582_03695 [Patescibacteria group bacterium]